MPRITRLLAPGPEELTLSAGAMRARSDRLVTPRRSSSAPDMAVMLMGTVCAVCSRLVAVTTMSSRVLGVCWGWAWRGGLGRSQLRGECLGEQRGGQKGGAGLVHGGRCPGAGMGVTARGADALIMIKNFDCVNKI
jgi:hypothetical protein